MEHFRTLWEYSPVLGLDERNFSHCVVDCRSIVLKTPERWKVYLFLSPDNIV